MSEATLAPPPGAGAATFLLTVRGKARAATTEEARTLHNSTAGNPAGVEAARSLGDLSHQVFTGYGDLWMDAEKMNGYYDLGLGFDVLGPVFAGEPVTSVWRSAPGDWTEW
jgi:hypothetical protein